MSSPLTLSLDGDDWSLDRLPAGEWERRRVWEARAGEAGRQRLPASVPGLVQEALLRMGDGPDPRRDPAAWAWVAECDWVYEKRFRAPSDLAGSHLRLRFEGLTDCTHVFLNGTAVGEHDSHFAPAEWDVSGLVRPGEENHLVVLLESSATDRMEPLPRWRPWFPEAPEFRGVGIWDSVSLRASGPAWFRGIGIHTNLSIDHTEAALSLVYEFGTARQVSALIRAEITQSTLPVAAVEDPITLFRSETSLVQSATLPRVQLWWPNGLGRQPLYEARLSLLDEDGRLLDHRVVPFGVRQIDREPCEGAPEGSPPHLLQVNGRRVWIQGWSWVPADLLYGGISEERYDRFLRLAREAGVNLLRVRAGGLIEKEVFYRLCDRYGLLVWQEFPLAGEVSEDPAYVTYAQAQAEAILPRRRNHPSLYLWCGGSGLQDAAGRPLDDAHPVLRALRESVELDDPGRGWLSTTGGARGPKPGAGGGPEVRLPELARFCSTPGPPLLIDWGPASPPAQETLRRAPEPRQSPGETPPQSREAGLRIPDRTPEPDLLASSAFGPIEEPAARAMAEQLLQALALQCGIEAQRRRVWCSAGAIPEALNESRPADSPAAVDYWGRPKPAYYAARRAYASFHVSAEFPSFIWSGESAFRAEVWLHNSGAERSLLNVVATVLDLQGRELYQENLAGEAPAESAENVGDLYWRFPAGFVDAFVLFLSVVDEEGDVIARSAYPFSRAPEPAFAPFRAVPETTLAVEAEADEVTITNSGSALALWVEVRADGGFVEDSSFPLEPGASRRIRVRETGGVQVSAWNAAAVSPG